MSSLPLLNAAPGSEADQLRLEIARLREEWRAQEHKHQDELREVRQQTNSERRALEGLRHQLEPLYRSLQRLFGELDAVGIGGDESPATSSPVANSTWESWKQRLGGKQAEFITVLQMSRGMTRDQIRIATHSGWSTVDATLAKLRDLGLVVKEDNLWKLKQL